MFKRVSCQEIPIGTKMYVERRQGKQFLVTEKDQQEDVTEECSVELKKNQGTPPAITS